MLNIKPADGDNFIRCLPALEKEIGEKAAKLLLQLEFWIRTSSTPEINGKRWTYQSSPDIQKKAFQSWSTSTINRTIKKLETLELIQVDKFNKAKYDKTRWFSLDPVGFARLTSIVLLEDDARSNQIDLRSTQNDLRSNQNDARSTQNEPTIPETPTEITPETPALNTTAAASADAAAGQIQNNSPEKVVDEKPMQPVKVETVEMADDAIEGMPTPAAKPITPLVAQVPPIDWLGDDDCPDEPPADLKAFFNACKAGELEALIERHGVDVIRATIDSVRLLPNVDNPPGMVRHKLGLGALPAWKWPARSEDDASRYITGKYADFIQH